MNILDSQGGLQSVNSPDGLPFRSLAWINDHEIVCAGYSCHPILFSEASQGWKFAKNLDKVADAAQTPVATGEGEEGEDDNGTFGISALRKFKELDLKGKVTTSVKESAHENAIMELAPFAESNGQVTQISSCGLDGKIVLYTV